MAASAAVELELHTLAESAASEALLRIELDDFLQQTTAALALALLGGEYTVKGGQLRDRDYARLVELLQELQPFEKFWERALSSGMP